MLKIDRHVACSSGISRKRFAHLEESGKGGGEQGVAVLLGYMISPELIRSEGTVLNYNIRLLGGRRLHGPTESSHADVKIDSEQNLSRLCPVFTADLNSKNYSGTLSLDEMIYGWRSTE